MTIPKDLIEQAKKEFRDTFTPSWDYRGELNDRTLWAYIEKQLSLAYRRGAEDMGKAIDEVKEGPIDEPWDSGFNAAIRLIQERKDNFLKQ